MRAILVPVKSFANAKQRLAAHFSGPARAALIAAMCEDVFRAVTGVKAAERVFVVSAEPMALQWARDRGWETIVETAQISENHSVDMASHHCAALGIGALLRLPIDIPLVQSADIEAVLAAAMPAPFAVLVPSRDGTGTNALLRSPPDLFASHFGPGSFALHRAEAERAGARVTIHANMRLGLDIDELADLSALDGRLDGNSATARWIAANRP